MVTANKRQRKVSITSTLFAGNYPTMATTQAVKTPRGVCAGLVYDKQQCGDTRTCDIKQLNILSDGRTQWTCSPTTQTESTSSPVPVVTVSRVVATETITIGPPLTQSRSLTQASLSSAVVHMATCGGTVTEGTPCPSECPVTVIPGMLGVVSSCSIPGTSSSEISPSTPSSVEASATSVTFTEPTPTSFETSASSATSTAAAPSSNPAPFEQKQSFEQTPAGKATITVSIVGGFLLIALAVSYIKLALLSITNDHQFFLWQRRKRKTAEKEVKEPEGVQLPILRSDVEAVTASDYSSSRQTNDGTSSDTKEMDVWELVTNRPCEELLAIRAAQLRDAERKRQTATYRAEAQAARRASPDAFPF